MKKIWLVDSDAVLMEGVNIALGQLHVETCMFSNPFAFLRELSRGEPPALIVLNMQLAGVDTRDILHVLRKHPDFAPIPVIVMANEPYSQEIHESLLRDGACDVLRRDMRAQEFNAIIQSFLNSSAAWTVLADGAKFEQNLSPFLRSPSAANLESRWFLRASRQMFASRIDSKAV